MTLDNGLPFDALSLEAASQLVKLAVSDGWNAAKSLVQRLTKRGGGKDEKETALALPEPAGALDDAFTRRLAAHLQSDDDLRDAIIEYFKGGDVGDVRVSVRDNAQAAVQGSGIQNNNFRAR